MTITILNKRSQIRGDMVGDVDAMRAFVTEGIPSSIPEHPGISTLVDHAPKRRQILTKKEKRLAQKCARYFPKTNTLCLQQNLQKNWMTMAEYG